MRLVTVLLSLAFFTACAPATSAPMNKPPKPPREDATVAMKLNTKEPNPSTLPT